MSVPTTQKAIRIHENGGPEVIRYEDVPVPGIADNQILVKTEYSGVNFIESYFREGLYKAELPLTLGREGAGEVVKVGANVKKFAVGDKVGYCQPGAYCEYIALNENARVVKVPDNLDTKQVSASLIQGLTAFVLTTKTHPVKKGDYVLIHAAAGGTGAILVQLAAHFGANIIATTSTPEKMELVKKAGAQHVINYKTEDVVARVKEITSNKGVAVSFDSVGKTTWDISMESLGMHGHMVSFGNASGAAPPFSVLSLSAKNISVTRPVLFNYIPDEQSWDEITKDFFALVNSGTVKIAVSKVYPLKDFATAITDLESGKTTGKLIMSHL